MKVIGIGNTAEVLDQGDGKACKLFYEGYPYNSVEFEYNNAKIIQTMDIPVPKVYELVKVEGRAGIIYEKLEGQSVLEKLLQDGDVNSLVNKMVNLHKEILERDTERYDGSLHINGMGLTNIFLRLRLYYGDASLFKIENRSKGGAQVTIGGVYEPRR